jgi:hypothetical protein
MTMRRQIHHIQPRSLRVTSPPTATRRLGMGEMAIALRPRWT